MKFEIASLFKKAFETSNILNNIVQPMVRDLFYFFKGFKIGLNDGLKIGL